MSENCRFDIPAGAQANGLTVGERFTLTCEGLASTQQLGENPQIKVEKPDEKYQLHVLDVAEASGAHFKLVVTSYMPGEYHKDSVTISDGLIEVKTGPLDWKVASVLNPQEPPQPVPSQGPFALAWPLWLWVAIGGAILGLVLTGIFISYRRTVRKRRKAELEKYQTALAPFSQFSRDMRAVQRKLSAMKSTDLGTEIFMQMNSDFRLYLIRELGVPALQVSDNQILREIRREHRVLHAEAHVDLRRALTELTKAQTESAKVTAHDCEGLALILRKVADHIHELKRKVKAG